MIGVATGAAPPGHRCPHQQGQPRRLEVWRHGSGRDPDPLHCPSGSRDGKPLRRCRTPSRTDAAPDAGRQAVRGIRPGYGPQPECPLSGGAAEASPAPADVARHGLAILGSLTCPPFPEGRDSGPAGERPSLTRGLRRPLRSRYPPKHTPAALPPPEGHADARSGRDDGAEGPAGRRASDLAVAGSVPTEPRRGLSARFGVVRLPLMV